MKEISVLKDNCCIKAVFSHFKRTNDKVKNMSDEAFEEMAVPALFESFINGNSGV